MNVFTFVLSIVTVVLCAEIIKTYIKNRNARSETDDDVAETRTQIDRLEERIQVLERIVTESRFDLKRRIDNL